MGDRVDDIMTEVWPDIDKAITAGLGLAPALKDYVGVEESADSKPYRVISLTWTDHPYQAYTLFGAAFASLGVCEPTVEGAIRLTVTLELQLDELGGESALQKIKLFAEGARRLERQTILRLIAAEATIEHLYDLASIEMNVIQLGGECRLIANDTLAEKAKEQGTVEDVVNPHGCLPPDVKAMLVRLGDGPTVRRVVDDLTCTWQRMQGAAVLLTLSEMFFLDEYGQAAKFITGDHGRSSRVSRFAG